MLVTQWGARSRPTNAARSDPADAPRSVIGLSEFTHTVEIDHHDVCFIRAPYEPELRRAIRAIPGRFWDSEDKVWRIRLGPDRAEAIARLLEAFPRFTPANGAIEALDALRRQRDLRSPGIESVVPDGVV